MLFLGLASNYRGGDILRHTFAWGTRKDSEQLRCHLASRYDVDKKHVALYHNGRSALSVAIKYTVPEHSEVLVVGFTCHAVIQAVKAAKCTPVFADIDPGTLHYNLKNLKETLKLHPRTKAIIIQNTLGIPVEIEKIEKVCKKLNLKIIEDLAHCTGAKYPDGREVGTVGDAVALSFGKGKSIDTISGGAVIVRNKNLPYQPGKKPKPSDRLRDRWYPVFGVLTRALYHIKIGKYLMSALVKLHWVQRSADAHLDQNTRLTHWQAKLALRQLQKIPHGGAKPLRNFYLVKDRTFLYQKLEKQGYYFAESWYDVPISPARYYESQHFPEDECPVATKVASEIVNVPTWYPKQKLRPAVAIIKEHQEIYQKSTERSKNES